jgi:hypothetical protein
MNLLPRILVSAVVLLSASTLARPFATVGEPQSEALRPDPSGDVGADNLSDEEWDKREESRAWQSDCTSEKGLLTAYLPKSSVTGDPLMLTLSIKNVKERAASFESVHWRNSFQVWMRDDAWETRAKGSVLQGTRKGRT